MKYTDIELMAQKQFMLDIGLKENDSLIYRVSINKRRDDMPAGRRIYRTEGDFFRLIVSGEDAYILSEAEIYDWAAEYLGHRAPEHMLNFHNLRCLDEKLKSYGYMIDEVQECFLPSGELFKKSGDRNDADISCPDDGELKELLREGTFAHALVSEDKCLTALMIRDETGKKAVAVAGAQRDGKYLWQIGVDVLEAYRGRGYGKRLVRQLALKLLKEDKLPFYGVRQGNIISKRTAAAAGFEPAFSEVHVCPAQPA